MALARFCSPAADGRSRYGLQLSVPWRAGSLSCELSCAIGRPVAGGAPSGRPSRTLPGLDASAAPRRRVTDWYRRRISSFSALGVSAPARIALCPAVSCELGGRLSAALTAGNPILLQLLLRTMDGIRARGIPADGESTAGGGNGSRFPGGGSRRRQTSADQRKTMRNDIHGSCGASAASRRQTPSL